MYKRKIYQRLLEWKQRQNHKPLIVRGLRQIGKTTLVEEFAKDNYSSYLLLDFRKDISIHSIFDGDFDINQILISFSFKYPNFHFIPNKTVLIFDEIQDCPNARSSLKYFYLDGRVDVICTGSLLGIKNYKFSSKRKRGIPVGYEEYLDMKPMDFEEYLWANRIDENIVSLLKECIKENRLIPPLIHDKLLSLFKEYICVGGMPEVVDAYLSNISFNAARRVQKRILEDYSADFGTHLNDDNSIEIDEFAKIRINKTFLSIPNQLAKKNQKFKYSSITKNAKAREYKNAIEWLEDYGLISRCYNLTNIEMPLESFKIEDVFKIYINDSGLYLAMLDDDIPNLIMNNNLGIAKGPIYENIVSDAFGKLGLKLYYFHKDSGLEIDFITKFKNELSLVEVKSKSGHTKSAKTILNDDKYDVKKIIKFSSQNIGVVDNIYTYPYYLVSFLF